MSLLSLKPIISEKSLGYIKKANEYVFEVDKSLTKTLVKKLVEESFGVKVKEVRVSVLGGKTRRKGARRMLRRYADRKRVIVRLDKKEKIDLFEIKEEGKKKI